MLLCLNALFVFSSSSLVLQLIDLARVHYLFLFCFVLFWTWQLSVAAIVFEI